MPLRCIYVDLNSYFASVEQAEDPRLMGRAVAVVPSLAETTSCLAASYPAKAHGIRTGTLVRDARRRCPHIIFVQADHKKYVRYHHEVVAAVERCLPVWRVYSIDEMAIRLYGREQAREFACQKAHEIKRSIAAIHPALTCSIGIAPNRYLAKVASDMQKPDGLTVINSDELPARLYNLTLRDLPGIGPRMEERLFARRCSTVKALCERSPAELRELWGGKMGEDLWRLLRGEELAERETQRGSISHSRVLSPQSRTPQLAWAHLVALLSKAAMRLRESELLTRSLQVNVKFLGSRDAKSEWEKRARIAETQDTAKLIEVLALLWRELPSGRILRVGVTLSALEARTSPQLRLFQDPKREALMNAFDVLNRKHRKNLIVVAESIELERPSHAAIAFGHIPSEAE